MKKTRFLVIVYAVFMICGGPFMSAAQLSVPITVTETKPGDVSGISRTSELASFGIPLKQSDNITSVAQLGLTGSADYQFRRLTEYPNGNIKWVLVDTLVDCPAEGNASVTLTTGSGQSAGADLAADNMNNGVSDTNYITVDTGAAIFVIRKTNFNFLDLVSIGGYDYIESNTSEGIVINDGSVEYSSANDSSSLTVIEENGPVRACIKSTGRMMNGSSNSYLHYSARLNFVKGKTYCKAYVTLINSTNDTVKEPHPVSEFAVTLSMNNSSAIDYMFAREDSEVTGAAPGYLYQGYNEKFVTLINYLDWDMVTGEIGLIIDGVTYRTNARELRAGGDDGEATQGYARISDGAHDINLAMNFMGGYWPAGYEVSSDGNFSVATYSHRNSVDFRIAWGQHQTREIILEFGPSPMDPIKTLHRLQYPLMGIAEFEHYRDTGGILGHTTLITIDEENQWMADNGQSPRTIANSADDMYVERHFDWNSSGGFQNDRHEVELMDWLKTGKGMLFNRSKEAVRHRYDDAVLHSEGFHWKSDPPEYDNSNTYYRQFDRAHMYWESMPLLYQLTGNEIIRESIVDLGEWVDLESSETDYRSQHYVGAGDMRHYSRTFKCLAILAELLNDQHYKDIVTSMVNQYNVYYTDSSNREPGRNYDRGFYDINCSGNPHQLMDNMMRLHSDAMYNIWRIMNSDPAIGDDRMAEDLSDAILGWAYFLINEELVSSNGLSNYRYNLYETNTYAADRFGDLNWFWSHAYDLTGDLNLLSKRECGYLMISGRGERTLGERATQSFIYRDLNRGAVPSGFIDPTGNGRVDLASGVVRNGSTFTLSWTVPENSISHYQIKFSEQPMVENLGFNQTTRTYQYDSSTYDNYWAAVNVQDEPQPGSQGSDQTYQVDIQTVMSQFNTHYDLAPGDPPYLTYDSGQDYYFAVKYWIGNSVSLQHVISALRVIAGISGSGPADADGDSKIGLSDAIYYLQATAGLR